MSAPLEAREVSKYYRQGPVMVTAVDAVSLRVEPGQS